MRLGGWGAGGARWAVLVVEAPWQEAWGFVGASRTLELWPDWGATGDSSSQTAELSRLLNTGTGHPGAGPGWGFHAVQATLRPGDIVQCPRPVGSEEWSEPSL